MKSEKASHLAERDSGCIFRIRIHDFSRPILCHSWDLRTAERVRDA